MRAYVFTDKALARHAGRFVWLDVDVERNENAALHDRYPIAVLPTYFILDPDSGTVLYRWVGGATVVQLDHFLDEAERAYRKGAGDADLARADRLYGEGKNAEASAAYAAVLRRMPEGWPGYGRSVEALLFALQDVDSVGACTRWARDAQARAAGTSSAAIAASYGLDCAVRLPATDASRATEVAYFEQAVRRALDDASLPLAADDRSGLYISLLTARQDAHDSTGARAVAKEWAAFLDGAAARAKTPDERAVFDSHRLSAYLELGEPERAVTFLQESERGLPHDYNPPARLAIALLELGRFDDALAANRRALDLAYGPRKVRVLITRADILAAKGDKATARTTLEATIAFAEALPEGQRSPATVSALRKRIEALGTP